MANQLRGHVLVMSFVPGIVLGAFHVCVLTNLILGSLKGVRYSGHSHFPYGEPKAQKGVGHLFIRHTTSLVKPGPGLRKSGYCF